MYCIVPTIFSLFIILHLDFSHYLLLLLLLPSIVFLVAFPNVFFLSPIVVLSLAPIVFVFAFSFVALVFALFLLLFSFGSIVLLVFSFPLVPPISLLRRPLAVSSLVC
uniref:Uncharacterized protein n=1 Tax=Cacopsylla melanoneura TaxID=428564 RepID=A0A8D8QF00_9HEMI